MMKGLLTKDALIIKKYCIYNILITIVFFAISIYSSNSSFFLYYSAAMISLIPITVFAYDEGAKWSRYEAILPIKKSVSVTEKYLLLLILVVPAVIIFGALSAVRNELNFNDAVINAGVIFISSSIAPCTAFPIIFKFGYLKGRILNIIIIAVMVAFITVLTSVKNTLDFENAEITISPFVFIIIPFVILAISYLISLAIYKSKEI